jgi:hypothetical protein
LESDGATYSLELNYCDGGRPAILLAAKCTTTVETLRSLPFSLPWGSSIYAKVVATNNYGDSVTSVPGNGATLMTYPDAPTTLTEVIASRSATSITFTWVDGANNNGAIVTDY